MTDWDKVELVIQPDRMLPRIQVEILGLDEQGRQTYRCPSCYEVGWFDQDGIGHCPHTEALDEALKTAQERLRESA